ncbi:alkaline phosphatase D [Colletotrichum spaethianum]|uniref:Alkaline phosphatase D n=1 Tax=Colletotrichum spaethianum TaxID=700344 RepID=A0AA37NZJ6_9PEZI|nr:alkaline phosphatase D [Colletotrichum spaethianum]GKT44510.1 alkaline phosphatase D [Colletotrichum spaethianum]
MTMFFTSETISTRQGKKVNVEQLPQALFSPFKTTEHGMDRCVISTHRADPDLQLLANDFAWIATWDDHEFANNGYRDGFSGLNNTEESFLNDGPQVSVDSRKANAVRAYFEWMPIR